MFEFNYQTTFFQDFSIADRFGVKAIRDTYRRAFNEWHTNVVYITELVIVLNHKIWQHYEKRPALAQVYNDLWEQADAWCVNNLTGDDLTYFYNTTD